MKKMIFQVSLLLALVAVPFLAGHLHALADCNDSTKSAIQCGVTGAGGGGSTKTLDDTIREVINLLSVAGGIAAVIMIILAGFKYITSAGASDKITSAKNTLLYAVIGLVVVALAQTVAHFVLTETSSPSTGTSSTSTSSTGSGGSTPTSGGLTGQSTDTGTGTGGLRGSSQ